MSFVHSDFDHGANMRLQANLFSFICCQWSEVCTTKLAEDHLFGDHARITPWKDSGPLVSGKLCRMALGGLSMAPFFSSQVQFAGPDPPEL